MDSDYIQKLLDNSGYVVLPDGDYNITKTLYIGSDTKLVMSPRVRLIRNANVPIFGTVPGSVNIFISGGVLNGQGPQLSSDSYANISYIFQSEHITLENMVFLDTLGSHSIDINASKDVAVINCRFLGYKVNTPEPFREAIQIDFASANALPIFPNDSPYYNLAVCENIRIVGCTFDKSDRYPAPLNAIGTHSQPNSTKKSGNILITGNVAKGNGGIGPYGFFVDCVNYRNVKIINNIAEGYTRFVRIYSDKKEFKADGTKITDGSNSYCDNIQITGNTVVLYERFKANGVYANSYNGIPHRNIQVMNNVFISNNLDTAKTHYLAYFNMADNIVVTNNTNNMIFMEPVRIVGCAAYCVNNNNYFSYI